MTLDAGAAGRHGGNTRGERRETRDERREARPGLPVSPLVSYFSSLVSRLSPLVSRLPTLPTRFGPPRVVPVSPPRRGQGSTTSRGRYFTGSVPWLSTASW